MLNRDDTWNAWLPTHFHDDDWDARPNVGSIFWLQNCPKAIGLEVYIIKGARRWKYQIMQNPDHSTGAP